MLNVGKSYGQRGEVDKVRSIVIDSLQKERTTNSAPLAYFYCARDASESQRADPDEVLRALLKQIACKDSTGPIREPVMREYNKRKREAEEDGLEPSRLSENYSTQLLLEVADLSPATIVIDALDECQPTLRYKLLKALEVLKEQSSNVVKILVSSRDDADLKARLQDYANIEIRYSDNQEDIERFVCYEIGQSIRNRRLLNGNVSLGLQDRLVQRLIEGANGMLVDLRSKWSQVC